MWKWWSGKAARYTSPSSQEEAVFIAARAESASVVVLAPRGSLLRFWQLATVAVFIATFGVYAAISLDWRVMVDSGVMHYVVLLMRHRRAPYVQISDNNMPGAYLVEAAGMALFGSGDLGWRCFEFSVLLLLTAGLVDLARRWQWAAGMFAAALFVALHSAEGPQYAAERELSLTTLLVLALAFLFRGVEDRHPALFAVFGLLTGLGASIKPTCLPFAGLALLLALTALHRAKGRVRAALLWACAGWVLVGLAGLLFLLHYRALGAFVFILRHVIPAYVGLGNVPTYQELLSRVLPRLILPAVAAALLLAATGTRGVMRRLRQQMPETGSSGSWQGWTLLLGAALGLSSFLLQRKGFLHHRYTLEIFLFLIMGLEFFGAQQAGRFARVLAGGALLFVFVVAIPKSLLAAYREPAHTELETALASDLKLLGGAPALDDNVQCFDLVFGCLDVLEHMDVAEDGSFTGDLLFFVPRSSEAQRYYRERFWRVVAEKAPDLLVVTNQNLESLNDFGKMERWPDFARWVRDNYALVVERHFRYEHFGAEYRVPVPSAEQDAYRLYVRRGSALEQRAAERFALR